MLKRFQAGSAKALAKGGRQCAQGNTSGQAAGAGEEVVVERVAPKPKPSNLPEDGSVVYRYGVPIRGKLSKLPNKEKFIICFVFSITGSSAVYFVRPTLKYLVDNGFLGLPQDAGFIHGPWLYRVLYFAVMWPTYTTLLFLFGGLFGRRIWFSHMIVKMWGRVLPKRATNYLRYMLDLQ